MNVFFLPEVFKYFEEVAQILYEGGYFGFKETAEKYTIELIHSIKVDLPICLHKPAPKYFDKYGKNMEYAGFRKNKNTMWYVFFQKYKENGTKIYLIRYIANNHTIAQYL
jgi:hypothetical protein